MPAPPTFSEALRRAGEALPIGVTLDWRPKGRGYQVPHYRVLVDGRPVEAAASLQGAVFKAMKHRGRGPAQRQLDFGLTPRAWPRA